MVDFIDVMDHRSFKRFPVCHNGRFFSTGQNAGWRECTIIDVSRKGILIACPLSEKIAVGATVCLEIYVPKQMDPVNAKGTVKWVKETKHAVVSGIELCKLLDEDLVSKLNWRDPSLMAHQLKSS